MERLPSNKIKTASTVLSACLMKRRSVLAAEVLGCAADVSLILNTPWKLHPDVQRQTPK